MYDDGTPFNKVDESNLVAENVIRIPIIITAVKITADKIDE